MTTSQYSEDDHAAKPRDFVETLVGGLAGATIGVILGLPVANAFSENGLEAVATALLILFVGLCVGAALGVGIALKLRRRTRPLLTAFMTLPAMFIGAYVAIFLATRLADTDILLLPFVATASILALVAARGTAKAGRARRDGVRED